MVGTADSSFLNVGALSKVEKHQQNYAAGGVDGLVLTVLVVLLRMFVSF